MTASCSRKSEPQPAEGARSAPTGTFAPPPSVPSGPPVAQSAAPDTSRAYPVFALSPDDYAKRRKAFVSKLEYHGPSPQPWEAEEVPSWITAVTYPSGNMQLKAWVAYPPSAKGKVPAVLFLHGGFAFGIGDMEVAKPFLDAGYALMCPSWRGENGNPGDYEMYLGEVDDAKAAVKWFAAQPRVDASKIYVFGHSAGGVISTLLALEDAPIRHSGSSGGLYGPKFFDVMAKMVPFDLDSAEERNFRSLLGNMKAMRHPHYAFYGHEDRYQEVAAARAEVGREKAPLFIEETPGGHLSAFEPGMKRYLEVIRQHP